MRKKKKDGFRRCKTKKYLQKEEGVVLIISPGRTVGSQSEISGMASLEAD